MNTAVYSCSSTYCETNLDTEERVTVSYYAVKTPCINNCKRFVYSVLCVLSREDEISESEFVYDVTRTERTAVDLIKMLCENTVTPCTLRCVLGDLL